ncbi:hypothetical protein HJFPF1_00590 [Paramyrothecium foliicola]|nr:hypothetical protein HJFPF1_00590 [Paramyrothecium foliicola]
MPVEMHSICGIFIRTRGRHFEMQFRNPSRVNRDLQISSGQPNPVETLYIGRMMGSLLDDEDLTTRCCVPLSALTAPVEVGGIESVREDSSVFFEWPILGPLLFENESSDARDHCANERTFLAYVKLSLYMAVMSVAITLSFHLRHRATELEQQIAKPLGAVFWALSVLTLCMGVGNYIKTVNKYSRRTAIVQTGWKTQLILGATATCIVGTCIILLVITKLRRRGSIE